jgi:hypothetical protein
MLEIQHGNCSNRQAQNQRKKWLGQDPGSNRKQSQLPDEQRTVNEKL